jgi:hypothetical protein
MLWDRYVANSRPDVASVPGYDFLARVPHGYEAFAELFLDSHSPQKHNGPRVKSAGSGHSQKSALGQLPAPTLDHEPIDEMT